MPEALRSPASARPAGLQRAAARPLVAPRMRPVQLGTRYLGLVAASAAIAGLAFKSELLAPAQIWEATVVLLVVMTAGLMFLHAHNQSPTWYSPDYYISPALAVIATGGFSMIPPDWLGPAASLGMGAVIYSSSYVDYCRGIGRARPLHRFLRDAATFLLLLALFFLILQSELPNVLKFIWIFAASLLGGYRSFRLATHGEWRALFSAFVTAQLVTALAFGMETYLNQGPQYLAVVLAFAWYANQGLIVHALEDTLTRRVFLEYGIFALICIYLVALALVYR